MYAAKNKTLTQRSVERLRQKRRVGFAFERKNRRKRLQKGREGVWERRDEGFENGLPLKDSFGEILCLRGIYALGVWSKLRKCPCLFKFKGSMNIINLKKGMINSLFWTYQ